MGSFLQDLRHGLRVLRKSPGFTVVAVFTLALGISAVTTVFTWIDAVLLDPIPGAADARRLVAFETILQNGEFSNTSYRDHLDYLDNLKQISGLAVWTQSPFSLGDGDTSARVWGELISGDYFRVMGIEPELGRLYAADPHEDAQGAHPVAVISDRLWRSRFHADPGVVGRTLRVNRRELTVIGVAPRTFRGGTAGLTFDIWVPLTMASELKATDRYMLTARPWRGLFAVARLRPGVSLEAARAEVSSVAASLAAEYPDTNRGIGATLLPLADSPTGAQSLLKRPLEILMAVCGVVLLIACGNIANLLLARTVARQKEFSVRLALGAKRARLVRQVLTETCLLAAGGTIGGLVMAAGLKNTLLWLLPPTDLSVSIGMSLNLRVLEFSILAGLAATLLAGTAPALYAARSGLVEALNEGGRGGGQGTGPRRITSLLVIAELALSAVALVGTGLFLKSFENTRMIHPGFEPGKVLLSQFYLPGTSAPQTLQFCLRLHDRLVALPGITAVSYADTVPLGFSGDAGHDIEVEGYAPGPNERMNFSRTLVAPGYFSLMRIPLLAGRDFADSDDDSHTPVMIVNQAFSKRFFHGTDPIGRRVKVSAGTDFTVVGVAGNIKHRFLAESPQPYFYMPMRQRLQEGRGVFFFLRTSAAPIDLIPAVRQEAIAIDPSAASVESLPLAEYITASLYPQRVAARLLSVLGMISLLLSAVGLYGVLSYSVSRQTHEIGIRMALGACPGDIIGMVLRQAMLLTAAGLAIGSACALALTRLVAGMLVSTSPADPWTFATAALFLGVVSFLAAFIPARHAGAVDPIKIIR